MKKLVLLFTLIAGLALVLSACGAPAPAPTQAPAPATAAPATAAPTAAPAKPFRVAVVMPSAKNDLAFSQSMYDALVKIQTDMGGADKMEIAYSENMFNVDDATAALRDYASKGYNLVIAHGSQYCQALKDIAPDFSQTSFACGTTADTFGMPNVFAYQAAADEGGYVNGVLAASLTKSKVVGEIGPIETGDAKLYIDGFKAGVTATNAAVKVNKVYIGSFSDTALAASAADTQIKNGADVLTGSAQMVVGAVGKAKDANVLWFGTQSNQSSLASSIVVASQVYHWEVVLKDMISAIQSGTLGGKTYTINLANGGEVIEYNPGYSLPADAKAAGDAAIKGITDGTIKVPAP